MPKNCVVFALAVAVGALLVAGTGRAKAEFFGCDNRHSGRYSSYASPPSYRAGSSYTREFAAQSRPRIVIHPRHHAERHCRSWLTKEYRVSGPVIVPRTQCWWD